MVHNLFGTTEMQNIFFQIFRALAYFVYALKGKSRKIEVYESVLTEYRYYFTINTFSAFLAQVK